MASVAVTSIFAMNGHWTLWSVQLVSLSPDSSCILLLCALSSSTVVLSADAMVPTSSAKSSALVSASGKSAADFAPESKLCNVVTHDGFRLVCSKSEKVVVWEIYIYIFIECWGSCCVTKICVCNSRVLWLFPANDKVSYHWLNCGRKWNVRLLCQSFYYPSELFILWKWRKAAPTRTRKSTYILFLSGSMKYRHWKTASRLMVQSTLSFFSFWFSK